MADLNTQTIWLLLLLIGGGTFLIRLSFIHLFGKIELPPLMAGFLRYVPPAVLSALVLPAILIQDGQLTLSLGNGRLVAAGVAALVAVKSKSAIGTIGTGMAVLWIVQALG